MFSKANVCAAPLNDAVASSANTMA
jgi:hypothetical protein